MSNRKSIRLFWVCLVIGCSCWPLPVAAQEFEALGTRALGMGGAFVAVADDASAVYWNPAGLASGPTFNFTTERETHDLIKARDQPVGASSRASRGSSNLVALAVPVTALSYYRLGVTEIRPPATTENAQESRENLRSGEVGVSSLATHHLGVTVVQSVVTGVAVGATLRIVRAIASRGNLPGGRRPSPLLDEGDDLGGRARNAFDLDAGALAIAGPLRVGLVARNLREPAFASDAGGADPFTLRRHVRLGLAFVPGVGAPGASGSGLSVAADFDLTRVATVSGERRNVAVGAERWWMGRRVGLRGGVRGSAIGATRIVGAGGASLALRRGLLLEGQVTRSRDDEERGWSLGARVTF